MRQARIFLLIAASLVVSTAYSYAQQDVVGLINEYGKFDSWSVREIEESGIIGGATKYLYEFYGNPSDTLRTGKTPFSAPDQSLLPFLVQQLMYNVLLFAMTLQKSGN